MDVVYQRNALEHQQLKCDPLHFSLSDIYRVLITEMSASCDTAWKLLFYYFCQTVDREYFWRYRVR